MEIKEYIREFTLKDVVRVRNPRVVAFGGGTGLSVILRCLKKYTNRLTAVVTMADDGGSSGMLREDLGILPPGDIRNCILALSDDENVMQSLFNYRFGGGGLDGHSFGNLFLAAMAGISSDFYDAVRRTSDVLQITGRVLPVTLDEMVILGTLKDGQIVEGESRIPQVVKEAVTAVDYVALKSVARALPETLDAIKAADIIIIGPGSLYTSVIPHLLVEGVEEAITESRAKKFYIANLMTQPGETTGYSQADHIEAIEAHCFFKERPLFQYIVANDGDLGTKAITRYHKSGAALVKIGKILPEYDYLLGDYAIQDMGRVRHDADELARQVFQVYLDGGIK
ncbi:gluconeogenesis factor YvcK family protein [Eubacterium aggregans]|uniref:gluconeogenesis factor YvcK family protein n=2 Tax=Eubacterium aggregans TaxID=81409 RepID=UPI003F391266